MMTSRQTATRKPRIYLAEINRSMRDNIQWVVDFFERHGIIVKRIPHPTAMLLERPTTMTWSEFKNLIRSVLQPRIGSVVVSSCSTGRIFFCDNKGNRPGMFQRVE